MIICLVDHDHKEAEDAIYKVKRMYCQDNPIKKGLPANRKALMMIELDTSGCEPRWATCE